MVLKYGLVASLAAVVRCSAIAMRASTHVANGPEAVPRFIWCSAASSKVSSSSMVGVAVGGAWVARWWRVPVGGSRLGGNSVFLIASIRSGVNVAVGMCDVSRL